MYIIINIIKEKIIEIKYVVLEMQTMTDDNVGCLVTAYDSQMQAESAYHNILASAALSDLPRHAAILLTSNGFAQMFQHYEHNN